MVDQHLTAEIYRDALTPEMSIEPALHGIDIIHSVTPWVRILSQDKFAFEGMPSAPINVENTPWPDSEADIIVVLTRRPLLNVIDSAAMTNRLSDERHIGATLTWIEPRLEQVVITDVSSICRPEHIVAHELGHVMGVRTTSKQDELHCESRRCLMFSRQYVHGRADRTFCECCSQQIYDNSLLLRRSKVAKNGLFATKL